MKGLTGLNNVASNGKIGVGGAVLTFVMTVIVIILETRKSNTSNSYKNGDELFLLCVKTGKRSSETNGIQTFLSCTVQYSKVGNWYNDAKMAPVISNTEKSIAYEHDKITAEENLLRSDSYDYSVYHTPLIKSDGIVTHPTILKLDTTVTHPTILSEDNKEN